MLLTEKTLQRERYRIIDRLELTDGAAVYEAYDNIFRANVILKEFTTEAKKSSPAQILARKSAFVEKARILTGISHDLLPKIHDYFSEADNHYLVMEKIGGKDLGTILEINRKPFSLPAIADWADQLLDALNLLHKHVPPVVHGNIKPQNIKFVENGKIKLSNFGNIDELNPDQNAVNGVYETAALPYLPLEQIWQKLDGASQKVILHSCDEKSQKILEQPIDSRTDIYAVGATLYQLATGKIPADALARTIDLMDGNADPLISPRQINAAIPPTVSDIILRAMEIRRENRFDSAVILRQVLRTAFVRIKELEAQKNEQAACEAEQAKQAELAAERRLVEQKQRQIETERQKAEQEQLFARQKESAEAERKKRDETVLPKFPAAPLAPAAQSLSAEPKFTKTHELVLITNDTEEIISPFKVKENLESDSQTPAEPLETKTFPASFSPAGLPAQTFSPKIPLSESNNDKENFEDSFSQTTRNKSFLKRAVFAGVSAAVLGATFFGIWMMSAKTEAVSRELQAPPMSLGETVKPAPSAELPAPPETPAEIETKSVPANSSAPEKPEITETRTAPAVKNKQISVTPTMVNPPKIQKTVEPAAKPATTPAVQKKPLTVDDIINDN